MLVQTGLAMMSFAANIAYCILPLCKTLLFSSLIRTGVNLFPYKVGIIHKNYGSIASTILSLKLRVIGIPAIKPTIF